MIQVPETAVKKRIELDNPWWEPGGSVEPWVPDQERIYLEPFFNLVKDTEVHRAVVLMGPRRVGKTVMLFQTIQKLIDSGVPPRNILYVSLETPAYTGLSLDRFLEIFSEMFSHPLRGANLWVFFDEIQYLREWEVHLKSFVDTHRSIRAVASGSAAAALKLKSRESGAGRFTDFYLPALTFTEFLQFVGAEFPAIVESVDDIAKLNQHFVQYINFGGYPEAVLSKTVQEKSSQYLKSDIIDKVLLRDLPSLYGISDIQELNNLFNVIAFNTGSEFNLDALSQNAGIAKDTIRRYLEYLEASFLVKKVPRIDQNARRLKRERGFKLYLTNPSIRSALFGNVAATDPEFGQLAETAVATQLLSSNMGETLHYARWDGNEIDFVLMDNARQQPALAVEVKWSDRAEQRTEEFSALTKFLKVWPMTVSFVTSRTKVSTIQLSDHDVPVIPTSIIARLFGKATDQGVLARIRSISNQLPDIE